jgi:hypothetical protein
MRQIETLAARLNLTHSLLILPPGCGWDWGWDWDWASVWG